jgi:hypothetical protein
MAHDYPFRSIFLDTNIVRYWATFPNLINEGFEDETEHAKLARLSPVHQADIRVLEVMMAMFQRGIPHGLVVTECVVRELPAGIQRLGYELLEWVGASGFLSSPGAHNFLGNFAPFLDDADRHLYLEANANGCDAFMTTDYKTVVSRRHLLPKSMTRVITPREWWQEIKPWAGLFL